MPSSRGKPVHVNNDQSAVPALITSSVFCIGRLLEALNDPIQLRDRYNSIISISTYVRFKDKEEDLKFCMSFRDSDLTADTVTCWVKLLQGIYSPSKDEYIPEDLKSILLCKSQPITRVFLELLHAAVSLNGHANRSADLKRTRPVQSTSFGENYEYYNDDDTLNFEPPPEEEDEPSAAAAIPRANKRVRSKKDPTHSDFRVTDTSSYTTTIPLAASKRLSSNVLIAIATNVTGVSYLARLTADPSTTFLKLVEERQQRRSYDSSNKGPISENASIWSKYRHFPYVVNNKGENCNKSEVKRVPFLYLNNPFFKERPTFTMQKHSIVEEQESSAVQSVGVNLDSVESLPVSNGFGRHNGHIDEETNDRSREFVANICVGEARELVGDSDAANPIHAELSSLPGNDLEQYSCEIVQAPLCANVPSVAVSWSAVPEDSSAMAVTHDSVLV